MAPKKQVTIITKYSCNSKIIITWLLADLLNQFSYFSIKMKKINNQDLLKTFLYSCMYTRLKCVSAASLCFSVDLLFFADWELNSELT